MTARLGWPPRVRTLVLAVPLMLWAARASVAQPAESPAASPARVLLRSNESVLWLAYSTGATTRLFSRDGTTPFGPGTTIDARVADLAVVEGAAFVVLESGEAYRVTAGQAPIPLRSLPQGATPLGLTSAGQGVYALLASEAAAALRDPEVEAPLASPLSIVWHDGFEWRFLDACPPELESTEFTARLLAHEERLILFWAQEGKLAVAFRALESDGWSSIAPPASEQVTTFWVTTLSGVPTVVAIRPGAKPDELTVFRMFGDVAARQVLWRRTELNLSPLPDGARPAAVRGALGFNQHLAVLISSTESKPFIRFARPAPEEPAEATVSVEDTVQGAGAALRLNDLIQQIAFFSLLLVLTGLFVFRRDSMILRAAPPAGYDLALRAQRLAGALIDFLPFSVAFALALRIPWFDSLRTIGAWALNPEATGAPATNLLLWWASSCGGYALYCLIMELLTRRTVGKTLLGVRLATERGAMPSVGQVLTRNLLRLVELTPQFWVFFVLFLASRNRQRLGDIFARTIAIRAIRGAPPPASGEGDSVEEDAQQEEESAPKE